MVQISSKSNLTVLSTASHNYDISSKGAVLLECNDAEIDSGKLVTHFGVIQQVFPPSAKKCAIFSGIFAQIFHKCNPAFLIYEFSAF